MDNHYTWTVVVEVVSNEYVKRDIIFDFVWVQTILY